MQMFNIAKLTAFAGCASTTEALTLNLACIFGQLLFINVFSYELTLNRYSEQHLAGISFKYFA